jgi:hypothetical protein
MMRECLDTDLSRKYLGMFDEEGWMVCKKVVTRSFTNQNKRKGTFGGPCSFTEYDYQAGWNVGRGKISPFLHVYAPDSEVDTTWCCCALRGWTVVKMKCHRDDFIGAEEIHWGGEIYIELGFRRVYLPTFEFERGLKELKHQLGESL